MGPATTPRRTFSARGARLAPDHGRAWRLHRAACHGRRGRRWMVAAAVLGCVLAAHGCASSNRVAVTPGRGCGEPRVLSAAERASLPPASSLSMNEAAYFRTCESFPSLAPSAWEGD